MTTPLESELTRTVTDTSNWGRRNFIYAHLVFLISVLGSFLASVLTAADFARDHKMVLTVLSALPGLMLLINSTLRFEDRTRWFWKKTRIAERYLRQLRDAESPDVPRLSAAYSEEAERLESEWPAFGTSPGLPSK